LASSPLSNAKFLLAYLFCWLIWIAAQAGILNWMGFKLQVAFTDSLISNLLLAASGVAISNNLRYYRPGKDRYLYIFLWSIGMAALWITLVKWILTQLLVSETDYILFLNKSLPVRFCIAFLITGWMAMLSWMWYNLEEQKENESRKTDAEKLAREAELYKLRQQLQPHFLFNSLNSISALAGSKPEEARHMIQQLSDFLRGTLKKDEQQQVSLKEELQHLQLYLDIEKVRFGHRLSTSLECDEASMNMLLPQLLLQPIVENAIKFGLYDTIENVTISIRAQVEQQQLNIIIQNPYDPSTAQPSGTGFGLKSVRRRLYLLYARNDLLETKTEQNTFTTIVKIPQHDQSNTH